MHLTLAYLLAVIIGLIGITIMIMIHELGHYIAAKAFGINVISLSFGFGPAWLKWQSKSGTIFKFGIIPFGGTCKMAGKDDISAAITEGSKNVEMCEDGSIYSVSPVKRMITYLCGPLSNIIFAFIIYAVLLSINVLTVFTPSKVALVSDYPDFYPEMQCAAGEAGIMSGDTVYFINGIEIREYSDIETVLKKYSDSDSILFTTDRGSFTVHPYDGKVGLIPYESQYRSEPGKPFFESLKISARQCFREMVKFIKSILSMLMGKTKVSSTLSGTFGASAGIGLTAERAFSAGFNAGIRVALYIIATVSVSMGIANLLPITALDGGLILIAFVELVIGKTLHPKAYVALQVVGILIVLVVIPVLRFFM